MRSYTSCDICGSQNPRFVLNSPGLDGPLVECVACGFRYVGDRRSALTFGTRHTAAETAANVRAANRNFQNLRLDEEHRLGQLNAQWRLDLIRKFKSTGKLLEIGCGRGDFLRVAREHFDSSGVEPNPELADDSSSIAPVYRDIIERTPWNGFDVVASFHVIEHVDSPSSFIGAAVERLQPGGLLVIETPNIDALPFKLLRSRWRQFIPEHYFFFSPKTISKLLSEHGLRIEKLSTIGKYASLDLILNRLNRHVPSALTRRFAPPSPRGRGSSQFTFRVNPMDIMIVLATKIESGVGAQP